MLVSVFFASASSTVWLVQQLLPFGMKGFSYLAFDDSLDVWTQGGHC